MAHGQGRYNQHDGEPYAITRHDFGGGITACFEMRCGKCRRRGWAGNARDLRLPPDAVFQIFRKLGWQVDTRKEAGHRCPECQLHPKTSDEKVSIMATVSSIAPRQLTGAEIRRVSDLLTENFDEKRGAFEKGWDDQKIADTVNVPRAAVTRLREEGWGKIKVFEDIENLKSEVASIKQMVADIETRIVSAERKRAS